MKYLTTIAVVSKPLLQHVRLASAKPAASRSVESVLRAALDENIHCVCFYRTLMDGWDATHRVLLSWIEEHRPAAVSSWKRFIKMGFLALLPRTGKSLLPRPGARDLRAFYSKHHLEDYALAAFVAALYDGLDFQVALRLPMILTARCVGGSMGDEEYGGLKAR